MTFQAACYLLLLGRLWSTGLAARYRFLSAYLLMEALGTGGLAWISIRSWTYTIAYFCITPLLWVLSYLVVLELCWLILEDYPGIAAVGRRIVSWSLGGAVLIAGLFAAYGLAARGGAIQLLRSFSIVHFAVRVGVMFFLLVILFFVYRYRLRLPRNRRLYGIGYALCWGLVLVSDELSAQFGYRVELYANYAELSVVSVLLIAGAVMLNAGGEACPDKGAPDTDERSAELHRRLAEMNRLLMSVGKRVNHGN